MSTVIVASYNDAISVSFRSDAWFNATQVAANFGKRPETWLRTDDTKEYVKAIAQICVIDEKQLVSVKRGAPDNGGGTWMHPKLGIPFARWLDPKFGVWCDMQIEKILHSQTPYALKDLRSKKALPGGLTLDQQDAIKALVKARVETLPAEKQGGAAIKLWSAIKAKFGCPYKAIPPDLLTDALSLVARVDLEEPKQLAGPESGPRQAHANIRYIKERIQSLSDWGARALPPSVYTPFREELTEVERGLTTVWTEIDESLLSLALAQAMLRRARNMH